MEDLSVPVFVFWQMGRFAVHLVGMERLAFACRLLCDLAYVNEGVFSSRKFFGGFLSPCAVLWLSFSIVARSMGLWNCCLLSFLLSSLPATSSLLRITH